MIKAFLAFTATVAALLLPSQAQASNEAATKSTYVDCSSRPLLIEIIPSFAPIKYERSLNALDLNSKTAWGAGMLPHLEIKSELAAENTYDVIPADDSKACVRHKLSRIIYRMSATVKFQNAYTEGSCEYTQVKAHQEQHIAAAKDYYKQVILLLDAQLPKAIPEQSSLFVRDMDKKKAQDFIDQSLNIKLAQIAPRLDAEFIRTQAAALDTTAQSTRLFAACPGWKAPAAP